MSHTGEHRAVNGNGSSSVPMRMFLGIIFATLGALLALYVNGVKQDADDTKENQRDTDLRVGAVEVDIASMSTELAYIRAAVLRIENKLDK